MPQSPVGTWKLLSYEIVDTVTGDRRLPFGPDPLGRIMLDASGRMMGILTPSCRATPAAVEDKAAAFDAMFAYSGHYRLEGDAFVTSVDVAWFQPWVGSEQRRAFRVEGNTMTIVSAPVRSPAFDNPVIGTLVWTREV